MAEATSAAVNNTGAKSECFWADVFGPNAYHEHALYHFTIIRVTAFIITFMLIHNRDLLTMKRYVNADSFRIFTFYLISVRRRVVAGLITDMLSFVRNSSKLPSCIVTAEFEAFSFLIELETLTHVCIERFVVSRYLRKQWKIPAYHYQVYRYLPLVFAITYTLQPIFRMASEPFSYDFTCQTCTFDMILPQNPDDMLRALFFYFIRTLKPSIMMIGMLLQSRLNVELYTPSMRKKGDIHYNHLIECIVTANLLFWSPLAIIRGKVLMSQFLNEKIWKPCHDEVKSAMMMFECSAIITSILVWYWDYSYEKHHVVLGNIRRE